ncbi:hypothetical protein [Chitiniphilus shinanonensis]|uniref:hypothetical protein n=1 Tax=Chitiniphilus shinanonensis TaxID=553088 RepID=UPI00304D9985
MSVTVGVGGGAGGSGPSNGGAGGTTSFGPLVSCPGGGGSVAGVVVSGPSNAAGGAGGGVPSGANILVGAPGIAGCWPVIAAIGASSLAIQPPTLLGAYGTGGAQTLKGVSSAARAGSPGGPGFVIVWEYA